MMSSQEMTSRKMTSQKSHGKRRHRKWCHRKWRHRKWYHRKLRYKKWHYRKWRHEKWCHGKWRHRKLCHVVRGLRGVGSEIRGVWCRIHRRHVFSLFLHLSSYMFFLFLPTHSYVLDEVALRHARSIPLTCKAPLHLIRVLSSATFLSTFTYHPHYLPYTFFLLIPTHTPWWLHRLMTLNIIFQISYIFSSCTFFS